MTRTALVTGGNRGIGLEICHRLRDAGLVVVATCRHEADGAEALRQLGAGVRFETVNLADTTSIAALLHRLESAHTAIDVLVNNAGIFIDNHRTLLEISRRETEETLAVNTLAPLQLAQGLLPGMMRRRYGRVVNVSSGMGQFDSLDGWASAYRLSKAALNAATVMLAETGRDYNVLVNAGCPGWVKTRMGGSGAHREITEGADTPVWLALLPDGSPTGRMWRDRHEIPF